MASGSSDAATSAMASGSSDAGNVCPWPASILLLEEGYLAARGNDTTARARSMDNHTVEVTFWIADPPAVSFYTLNCIKVPDSNDVDVDVDWRVRAVVVGAHGRFVLIRTLFCSDDLYEYFIYKGHPESPSLERIPLVPFDDMLNGAQFGIVPRGDDGHYLLVALRDMARSNHYRLFIYSSEDKKWKTKELTNPCPEVGTILDDKVFTLGDGLVLFVDLLKGMLICDLLQEQEPLRAQYIPLPEPLPGNREQVKKFLRGARLFRNLTCVDGLIKFIEIEQRVIEREIVTDVLDPRTKDVFHDSELISLSKHKPVEIKPKIQRSVDGWSAIIWNRKIGSNFWLKGSIVDVNDILVDDSVFSALLSKSKNESAGSLTFKDMTWIRPTLSTDGNDILYLKTFNQQLDLSVVAAIDLVEKTLRLEAPAVHKFGKYPQVQQILRPCALANQLKITPGIKVSANLIALMHRSANEPNSTAIRVGEPDSYDFENKRPRLLAEKVNHAQTGAQSTVQNVLISQAHPDQNNMPPWLSFHRYQQPGYSGYSAWPHQNNPIRVGEPDSRLLEVNHAQTGAQSTVQNVLAHPNQNNMPSWLSCNRYQQPGYSWYSSWPYENNPPPLPLNNWQSWVGPYNPVYAPSLPQRPFNPSMAIGPHMAHPMYTSTTGKKPATMGVGSSDNPYAYGAHSGIGLYHQHQR